MAALGAELSLAQTGETAPTEITTALRVVSTAAGLDDLPLFAAAAEPEHAPDPIISALDAIEPDSLTPREALEQLYALKKLAAERET